ncbi:MAG: SiaB family protein kinase [Myxococcales bacterium]
MQSIDLFKLRTDFARHEVLTCFNGPFSHGFIEEIGVAVRQHLEQQKVESSAVFDVFAVYIELAQNVKNYVAHKAFVPGMAENPDRAIITILWDGDRYAVAAGNAVAQDDGAALERRIVELNGLDKTSLRKRYKEQLRAPHAPENVGAGLGLLDIARRASGPLLHARSPLDAALEFFSILVRI